MIFTLLQAKDTSYRIEHIVQYPLLKQNVWFWIALGELLVIIFLIILKFKRKKVLEFNDQILNESKKADVDMGNIVDSIYHSKSLYDKLKAKCHPDRFTDSELNIIADRIFQEITQNKRNYKKLLELKSFAEKELNIKI
jgi:hypothetical protein